MDASQIFRLLISEIENSSLNYKISKTPFSATIYLKSSFVKYFNEALGEPNTEDAPKQEYQVHHDDKITSGNKDENKVVRKVEELECKLEVTKEGLEAAHKNNERLENMLKEEKSRVQMAENQSAELKAELLGIKMKEKHCQLETNLWKPKSVIFKLKKMN